MTPSAAAADSYQRRHPAVGFPLAVVYKFFDDQGNYLAAGLTYYAFVAIFPLLLIASSVLGFILQGDPGLERQLLNSALSQFPIVGDQLGRPQGLHGSTSAVVVGILAALYGALGVGQAGQNAMNVVWSVPRNTRPDPFLSRLRSLTVLAAAGFGVLAVTVVSSLAINVSLFGADLGGLFDWLLRLASVVVTALVLAVLFRLATASTLSVRAALPGAVVVSVLWHLLQWFGGFYVRHVVAKASSVNGVFALVLGLIVIIFLAAIFTLLGAEVNVVRERRLYPRALLTPFTDKVELTAADRRAYELYAHAQRHKGFERVHVTFDEDPLASEKPREHGGA
jgi:YihY family inner membrane protein